MQALVARELVHGHGLPERRAASLLGLVPSSVSQYLSGKRLGPTLSAYLGRQDARALARRTAQQLVEGAPAATAVLEAAGALEAGLRGPAARPRSPGTPTLDPELQQRLPTWLRNRIAGEQSAVAECMRLAQHSRDELTRAVFRQIASDSLRHAEIVAALAGPLDRGLASSPATGITRPDVAQLIQREHDAEATGEVDLGPHLGGVMRILWDSMEADERKHEHLLELLLEAAAEERPARRAPRKP